MLRWPFARRRSAVAEQRRSAGRVRAVGARLSAAPHNPLMEVEQQPCSRCCPIVTGPDGARRRLRHRPLPARAPAHAARRRSASICRRPMLAGARDVDATHRARGHLRAAARRDVRRRRRVRARARRRAASRAGARRDGARAATGRLRRLFDRASRRRRRRLDAHVRSRRTAAAPSPATGIRSTNTGRRAAAAGLRVERVAGAGAGVTRRITRPCSSCAHRDRRWPCSGRSALTFVNARVVLPEGRLARTLRVRGGRIDGLDVAPDKGDAVVDLDDSFVFPGLINAHDHLELNSQPRLKWRERYDNAREWIADFQPRFATDPRARRRAARHARRSRVGRRPEEPAVRRHHGLPSQPAASPAAPALSGSRGRDASASATRCTSTATPLPSRIARHRADWPWMIHAAEGLDRRGARRDRRRSNGSAACRANTVLRPRRGVLPRCRRARDRRRRRPGLVSLVQPVPVRRHGRRARRSTMPIGWRSAATRG